MEAFLISAGVVALAEIGDKTQLLAVMLAMRFRKPGVVIAGIFCATLANHLLASLGGYLLADLLNGWWMPYIIAISFFATAIWALMPDKLDDGAPPASSMGAFFATAFAFFLVEMGDKTQIATAALAARFQDVLWVAAGTTTGMMIANIPAVTMADTITRHVSLKYVRFIAALVFAALGTWTLAQALKLI